MNAWLAIAVGGAGGAVVRFWVATGIYNWLGRDFPHGTLFVNVSGSFLMGLLTELLLQRFWLAAEYRAAILVGFLGAYTTFSTFSLETFALLEGGYAWRAGLNIVLSVALCLLAVWLGLLLGRSIFAPESLSWLELGRQYAKLAVPLAFGAVAGVLVELSLRHGGHAMLTRVIFLFSLLTLLALLYALAILPHMAEPERLASLIYLFIASAMCSALSVGLGVTLGKLL